MKAIPAAAALPLLLLIGCGADNQPPASGSAKFWDMVARLEKASPEFRDSYETAKRFYLKEKSEDLAAFWKELHKQLSRSYRWDIWAVGAIGNGHMDVDFFLGYQIWLVLQGPEFYEAVLKDPTHACKRLPSTAPSSPFDYLFFQTAASNVYLDRTGKTLPDLNRYKTESPSGTRWAWKELRKMHPDLWDTYFIHRNRRPERPAPDRFKDDDDYFRYAVQPLRQWVDIYHDPDYLLEQYRLLSPAQRALHAVSWMKDEVDNGGLDQFFTNSTGVVAPEALEGLRLFGLQPEFDQLQKVMKAFPGGAPDRDQQKRRLQVQKRWPDKSMHEEFPISPRDAELEVRLARYIRAHPEEFFKIP